MIAALASATCLAAALVPAPWTPLEVSEIAGATSVAPWGRAYTFASNALPTSVKSKGTEMLAAPMRVVCRDAAGAVIAWTKRGHLVQAQNAERAVVCAWQEAPSLVVDAVTQIDYDGFAKVSLVLAPGPEARGRTSVVQEVALEIPLRADKATLFQFSPGGFGKLENAGAVTQAKTLPFKYSVWLGNEDAGFGWCMESDENFRLKQRDRAIEIMPDGDAVVLRVHFADEPLTLPATFVFGFAATPVKPVRNRQNVANTLHAPPMGVGLVLKRPETWWTAQRAFPQGDVAGNLDRAKMAGVKTIVFHEDWIPVQNNPSCLDDFKGIVDACHARGLKVLVYQGYELSTLDPDWGAHHDEWLMRETDGGFRHWSWYRPPAQRDYTVCYRSSFARTWLERLKAQYDALKLDGVYLDGTIDPRPCANARHGCGWTDAKGARHFTYPVFAVREMMRDLYGFVEARGGRIDAHQSGYVSPATLGFVHSYWDGEQIAGADVGKVLSLEAFRAEFMGVNHGVACEFLCYERPGTWTYENALALALLHDVLVRPAGFAALARVEPVWRAFGAFGVDRADWTPYWKHPLACAPSSVKASVYACDGRRLAVVSNVSRDVAVEAEVTCGPDAKNVRDACTGAALPLANGRLKFPLAPLSYRLLAW